MDEQDFAKAEIAKEKKQKLKKFKEKNSSLEEFFLPSGSAGKNSKNFWNLGKGGVLRPLVGHWSKAKSHLLTPWY